ncbi:hypothetical protein Syun_026656 [Stephania yunnanensis]|uniref:MYND-type domain-containing protein n=1 Tax=Stephania yunnanensis TaxID=152371 RepID=A0AAP0EUR0_9MAGN
MMTMDILIQLLQLVFLVILIACAWLLLLTPSSKRSVVVDKATSSATAAAAVPVAKVDKVCAVCGVLCRMQCSGCKEVKYCSISCQSAHWKAEHKLKCYNSRKKLVSCEGSATLPQIEKVNVDLQEVRKSSNSKDSSFVCEICDELKS